MGRRQVRDILNYFRQVLNDEIPEYAKSFSEPDRRTITKWSDTQLIDALNTAQGLESLEHRENFLTSKVYSLVANVQEYDLPADYASHVAWRFNDALGSTYEIQSIVAGQQPSVLSDVINPWFVTMLSFGKFQLNRAPSGVEVLTLHYNRQLPRIPHDPDQYFMIPDGMDQVIILRAARDLLVGIVQNPILTSTLNQQYMQVKGEWYKHGEAAKGDARIISVLETSGVFKAVLERRNRL